jgi:integrase
VRVSAKRQHAPLVLLAEQVKLGLANLEFRDQLLVFLIGALGTRRGEVGALRWMDCDFEMQPSTFDLRLRSSESPAWAGARSVIPLGTLLTDMGEHQLTIRDYLRHSNLSVTNKYLQSTSKTKRLAQEKLVDAILPTGSLSASKSTLIQ